jgi:hypothetical protein
MDRFDGLDSKSCLSSRNKALRSHQTHEPTDVPAIDPVAFEPQHIAKHSCASERMLGVKAIHLAHEFQISGASWNGLVVQRAAREVQQPRLMRKRQSVRTIDHRFCARPIDTPKPA